MSDPFLGELKLVGFDFAMRGWAPCNGQLIPIAQNQALFALLGTMYGGNGTTTFALPDLRGRVPRHVGGTHTQQGESAGSESVTLSTAQLPGHAHTARASSGSASVASPAGAVWAAQTTPAYGTDAGSAMNSGSTSSVGSSQPHENRQPYLVLNWVIALQGIFPSRS